MCINLQMHISLKWIIFGVASFAIKSKLTYVNPMGKKHSDVLPLPDSVPQDPRIP